MIFLPPTLWFTTSALLLSLFLSILIMTWWMQPMKFTQVWSQWVESPHNWWNSPTNKTKTVNNKKISQTLYSAPPKLMVWHPSWLPEVSPAVPAEKTPKKANKTNSPKKPKVLKKK